MAKRKSSWTGIGLDMWMMGIDAASVIWLRSAKIATGSSAGRKEAQRMVSEKIAANMALGIDLMTGSLGTTPKSIASKSVGHYSKKVRANRKRLSR